MPGIKDTPGSYGFTEKSPYSIEYINNKLILKRNDKQLAPIHILRLPDWVSARYNNSKIYKDYKSNLKIKSKY